MSKLWDLSEYPPSLEIELTMCRIWSVRIRNLIENYSISCKRSLSTIRRRESLQQMLYDIDTSVSPLRMMHISRDGDIRHSKENTLYSQGYQKHCDNEESCHIHTNSKISYSGRLDTGGLFLGWRDTCQVWAAVGGKKSIFAFWYIKGVIIVVLSVCLVVFYLFLLSLMGYSLLFKVISLRFMYCEDYILKFGNWGDWSKSCVSSSREEVVNMEFSSLEF